MPLPKVHKIIHLKNEQQSLRFALRLAQCVPSSIVMTFAGEIGSGKTTIIRAFLHNLGVDSAIKSPTFSLVESYHCNQHIIHHFDLYRIVHEEELEYIGFRDYFSQQSITCIEWPEHAGKLLPKEDIRFSLRMNGAGRDIQLQAWTLAGETILAYLAGDK